MEKVSWEGEVTSVQPRIRISRSFDQRSHSYLGFVLRVRGTLEGQAQEFVVALGKAAQKKHGFRVGDEVEGKASYVAEPRRETADLYRVSQLKLLKRNEEAAEPSPPFHGEPPTLEDYRERGHRRLASKTYGTSCSSCLWGCEMAVEMIIDQWNPSDVRYRKETFCYGPKSCDAYKPGPTRKVPGRNGMSYEEPDWIDEDATAHRGPDD